MTRGSIADYIGELPSNGRYTFTRAELEGKFDKSDVALKLALNRLVKKKRIICPRRGFYVVVPEEYRNSGAPPPVWFIDALMENFDTQYYVGLLSAADCHGAAHHRPQEFQVVCKVSFKPIEIFGYRIRFFKKWNVKDVATVRIKTPTGYMRVSSPEATALDLVRYYKDVGHYGNIVTVLNELAVSMKGNRLLESAKSGVELAVVQRLGYFLDLIGKEKLSGPLHAWLVKRVPRLACLRPDLDAGDIINRKWSLYINDQVEVEL